MKNCILIISCMLLVVYVSGCATVNPMQTHFENNFAGLSASDDKLIKTDSIKRVFKHSYDYVWDNALYILIQHGIIGNASKETGIIIFVDIDGVYFSDVFVSDRFLYREFPFTIMIEERAGSVMVSIHPMTELFAENGSKRKLWKIVETGFWQKGDQFLDHLSIQIESDERWPWLTRLQ